MIDVVTATTKCQITTDTKYFLKIIYGKKWMFSDENLKFSETAFS